MREIVLSTDDRAQSGFAATMIGAAFASSDDVATANRVSQLKGK